MIVKEGIDKDDQSEKKKSIIDFDLTKFFKDHEAADCINKL